MTNTNPMRFFSGSKKGVFISNNLATDVLYALRRHRDDEYDTYEEFKMACTSQLVEELEDLLDRHDGLSDETKAQALTQMLGRVAGY